MKCLDTYPLIEIHKQNPLFLSLLKEELVIPDITLAEFYLYLYKHYNQLTADYWHKKLTLLCKPVSREILIKAIIYRYHYKKENLSFFDCVGYMYAQEHNILFVTGDSAFQYRQGVEFIA